MLKNQQYIFFALIVFQFLLSCKKKDCNKVLEKGSVYDETTNKPIADATVILIANKSGCFSCSGGFVTKTIKTDKNGDFLMEFEGSSDYYYTMKAIKEKYYDSVEGGARDECSPDKRKKKLLYINPEAYLKLHIKNTQPFDESDSFLLGFYTDLYGNSIERLIGVSIDSII